MSDTSTNIDTPRKRARDFRKTYTRLMSYALHDKWKMVALITFSFFSASSLGLVLLTVPAGIEVLYASDAPATTTEPTSTEGGLVDIDTLIAKHKKRARDAEDWLEDTFSWRPNLEGQVESIIWAMRNDPNYGLRLIALCIVAITLFGGLARYGQQYAAGVISADIVERLRNELYRNLIHQSHDFFEKRQSGMIMARFSNDAMMVNEGLLCVFITFFREPLKVIGVFMVAFIASPKITFMIIFFISPLIFVFMTMAKKVKRRVTSQLNRVADVSSILLETIQGITVVKSFRMEEHEYESMEHGLGLLRRQMVKIAKLNALIGPLTEFFLVCGAALLLMMGAQIMEAEHLDYKSLVILAGAMILVVDPMRKISKINNLIQVSAVSAERVFAYIDAEPTVQEHRDPVDLPLIQEGITFEHVDFGYTENTPVLKDLTFTVKKGEMVALVGFSGAGKSTIAKLLPRFYDPTAGAIKIDGVDIREASFASLREQIGFVTQDNVLFNRSVHENISFSRESIGADQVTAAAKVAHAHGFIETLQDGYEYSISESGSNLSGGQKQRIAIARAIVKDPAILILDEATSSLDTESETAIQNAIDEFVVGRTTLVIAHRLSTIQRADRIIVLSQGSVAEEGTHRELIEAGGIYSRLHNLQFASVADPGKNNEATQ